MDESLGPISFMLIWFRKHHLLFSSLHATLGLALLLRCLCLVLPHARDVVFIPDMPALLRQNVHVDASSCEQSKMGAGVTEKMFTDVIITRNAMTAQ